MNTIQKIYRAGREIKFRIRNRLKQKQIIQKYLKENDSPRLHLACGERIIEGWLNADIYNGDVFVDATKPFPFAENTFDYIYSHQFIEHITVSQLEELLEQFYRVLKPKGTLRLVTPSLKKLIEIYDNTIPESEQTVRWYCKDKKYTSPNVFFNELFRQNGEHQYIYDFYFLCDLLEKHGFKNMEGFPYTESNIKAFQGIDDHGYREIDKISLCVEAVK